MLQGVGMIRLGTSADLTAVTSVYRRASLPNAGDRDNLVAHPEYLILRPQGLAEGRTHVAVAALMLRSSPICVQVSSWSRA